MFWSDGLGYFLLVSFPICIYFLYVVELAQVSAFLFCVVFFLTSHYTRSISFFKRSVQ